MNNNGRMILIVISCLVFSIFMRIGSVASQGMNGPPGAGTNYAIRMAAQGMKTHVPLNQGFVEGESMFYAPWCEHCKETKPIFEESALEHKETTQYVRIDCEAEQRLCYEYQIDGYPTFYYFSDNLDEVVSYGGPRTLTDFDTFISAQITERVDDPIQNVD